VCLQWYVETALASTLEPDLDPVHTDLVDGTALSMQRSSELLGRKVG
jgi:hypothetical protein